MAAYFYLEIGLENTKIMTKPKRHSIYVTLENGEVKKELIPLSFSDKDIVRFLHMKYGRQCWLEYTMKKVA